MFAASVSSDSNTVNKNATIINNATARSPYPRVDWFTNATGSLLQQCKLNWICSCRLCPRLPHLVQYICVWQQHTGDAEGAVRSPGNSSPFGRKGNCSGESLMCHIYHLSSDCISTSPNPHLQLPFHHFGEEKARLSLCMWKVTLVNNEELMQAVVPISRILVCLRWTKVI